uniref:Cionin n=1 Tax=Ciona intestinalis TaxID=7719 RepID=CION_CIOIN|nr:cionin precursor [Ciona intestinalis]P16240.2 RecName: Full=Cionin; Flags: Precursor [Ciona intestinalis]CAA48884.1 cionin [Ciona intestinalis]prf//1921183A procionin [Ciona intestinalis]
MGSNIVIYFSIIVIVTLNVNGVPASDLFKSVSQYHIPRSKVINKETVTKPLQFQRAICRLLQKLGEETFARLSQSELEAKQLDLIKTCYQANSFGDNENQGHMQRMDRNYYGWMDFGKRAIEDVDYEY